MADQVIGVTIKGIGDFSDVVSNVGSVQKALTKLKLPDKLGDSLNKNISNFMKEYDKYQKKIAEGIHTQGDQNAVNKSLNSMLNSYEKIIKDLGKISTKDFKDIFNLDEGQFASVQKRIKDIEANMKKIKLDPKQLTEPLKVFQDATKAKSLFGSGKGFDRLDQAFKNNNLEEAKQAIIEIDNYLTRFGSRMDITKFDKLQTVFAPLKQHVLNTDQATEEFTQDINKLNQVIAEIGERGVGEFNQFRNGLEGTEGAVKSVVAELKQMHANEFDFNRQAADIDRQIQSYFGLSQMIRKVGDIAKDAFATVKELDKAMTETAVVTNFSVGDMWDMLPTYTAQANQLGSTIKDVYKAATLYYQQGLNTNQAMGLANETLKMARIAGLDAAEATNMMTAALRGFNMEINQMSAQKVNDIYSELAAITASDTKEIGSAMERTASIANSANMDFATTSAFLAQMIETTREAPENLGTAMKTIVARFQEMKQDPTKLIDSEGVAMDANKVDTALKSIGVQLMNTKGEFRDLDDVFLDISAKWDSLTQGQQRYIATIAAGSRQQSRFIAMMSDYERTMELVDAANNSAGASQRQFEKTLDSMEAKLNMLKNAWNQFTMGLMNNQILKFGVDRLTDAFTIVNKFIDILGHIPPNPFEGITKSVLTLVTTLGMLNFGKKTSRGLVLGGAGWWKGETSFTGGFSQGWKQSGQTGFFANRKNSAAAAQGKADAAAYNAAVQNEMAKGGFTKAIAMAWKTKGQNFDFTNTFGAAFGQFSGERFAASWSADIEAEITRVLNSVIKDSAKIGEVAGKEFKQNLITQLKAGNISGEQLISSVYQVSGEDISNLGVNAKQLKDGAEAATNFGTKINLAGDSLLRFGAVLQGTPLAPFGSMLSTVGMVVSNFGSAFAKAATIFTNGMNMVVQSEITGSLATAGLAGGFKALWGVLLESPLFPIVAALLALYGTYKLLDAAIETNKERLEAANDAAAAASESYDSAKQETSELADSILKIQETESTFDGLVAGTAEFNDQLITANEQIMALIDKYPMLMDADKKYVSTDKNGLMHITQEGLNAVKDYQKQIQANASAMNLIQTADLNAVENQQKAQKIRNDIKTNMSNDERQRNLREADLLEQRAKAEVELARSNAIRTALTGKEIHDVDALTSVYTNLYETKRKAAETEVAGLSSHDIRQRYADYHGYTYNKSNKKITDVEGNEVDYDDNVIKDEVIEQTVLLDFEANASTLEATLKNVDKKFADTLDSTSERSGHFISDILSNNIDTNEDLLEQALSGTSLQDAVNSMTEKEMAAILGINAEAITSENIDAKRDEIVNLLTNNATKIAEAQAKSYEELGTMLAQSNGWDTFIAEQKTNQETIANEIKSLTAEQAHSMSNIGSQLKEGAGIETMQVYINHMRDLYKNINESGQDIDKQAAKEIEDTFNSVDISSATGRLEAYTKLSQSAIESTRNWTKELRSTAEEANLLGEVFNDDFVGGDWLELAEHADDFKNSLGQFDAAGIMKASEQSHTLKTLLDSGQVSASGLAMALQGIEDGKYSIGAVNSSVLQLLSSLNKVEDVTTNAHNIIENFDPGIDYSEAADFAKENAEKVQSFLDEGKYGNQQLQNYIKLAAGEDLWNKTLKRKDFDLEETTKALSKYVTTFKDGFQPVIDSLVEGKGINGKSLADNIDKAVKDGGLDETIAKKFKTAIPRIEGDNFIFGPKDSTTTDFTTDELVLYLEKAYGVSSEYAQLIYEEWANLSPDLAKELSKNDLIKAATSEDFKTAHQVGNGYVLTDQEIQILKDSNDPHALQKVADALGTTTKELQNNAFHVLDKNGNRLDNSEDHGALLRDYIQKYEKASGGTIESLLKTGTKDLFTEGKLDLSKLIIDTQAKGMDQTQAMQAAWQAYQRNEQLYNKGETTESVSYNGQDLEHGLTNFDQFLASIDAATEASKWESIGESLARGFLNVIEGKDNPNNNTNDKKEDKSNPQTSDKSPKSKIERDEERFNKQPGKKFTYDPNLSMVDKGGKGRDSTPQDKMPGWVAPVFQKISESAQKQKEIQEAYKNNIHEQNKEDSVQKNFDWWHNLINSSANEKHGYNTNTDSTSAAQTDKANEGNVDLTQAAEQLTSSIQPLSTAGENLNTAATSLSAAAVLLGQSGQNGQTSGQPQSSTVQGPPAPSATINNANASIVIDAATAQQTLDNLNAKVDEVQANVSEETTFNIGVNDNGLKAAGKNAEKISNAAKGDNNISVSTGEVNMDSVNNAKNAIAADSASLPVQAKDKTAEGLRAIKEKIANTSVSLKVKAKPSGTTNFTVTVSGGTQAKGSGYKTPYSPLPSFGSAARGRYGTVGPKNKGGLTLTGEKGYEIGWVPSENRSMILGASGPQMINLPKDTIIWNHQQSEEILKQKAIPAGSHFRISQTGGSSGGSGGSTYTNKRSGGKKGGSSKAKKKTNYNNWSIEEVVRFDIDQNLERLTSDLKRITDDIEKNLTKIGKTSDQIAGSVQEQIQNLKDSVKYNQDLADSYQRQFDAMLKATTANYKISYTQSNGKSADKMINPADYIFQNEFGTYEIDKDAISKLQAGKKPNANSDKALQESVFKEVSKLLSDYQAGRIKALDEVDNLQKQIEENAKKIADAYYLWENELTEVYDLAQQIAAQTAMQDRFSSQVALELARLSTGFGDTAKSIAIITKVNERNNQTLLQQIQTQKTMIEARERELDAFATGTDELEKLLAFRNMSVGTGENQFATQEVKDQAIAEAEQRLKTVEIARKYFVGGAPTKNEDGSLTYEIDWAKFNQDAIGMNDETGKAVKEYFEKLNTANVDYNNAIKENTDTIKAAYDKLKEYQDYIVGFEDTLLQQLDNQLQQEIDNAEKLSSTITASLKDLLDEVKRKLDERRKQEDNAKTERDISQKQQRLAALRADTSGGHQVEIAQLQKEIADAQQSYGRTLEDQLLDRLQQQGDEAARQREHQIELAQAQLDISNSNNKELVNMWLQDPVKYRDEIKEAWMQAQDYESKGYLAQKQLNDTFNSSFAELVQATEETKASQEGTIATITDVITGFGDTINTQPDSQISFQEQVTNALASISTALNAQTSPLQDVAYHNTQSGTNTQGSVGVAAAQSLVNKGATDTELKQAGVAQEVINQVKKPTPSTPPPVISTPTQQSAEPTVDPKQTYMDKLKEVKGLKANKVKSSHINDLFDLGVKAGYGKATVLLDLVGNTGGIDPFSWQSIFKAIINAQGIDRYNLVQTWPNGNGTLEKGLKTLKNPNTLKEIKKHKNFKKATALKFKTGGLADYTGPAWLDGTPSKPELVLNSTDTKNFLALRDVLSSAMNSMNTVSNSYGGDTLYEININVDKIEKDYDVDRVVEKVKKEITKGAGYRNVTQVRNLR